MSATNALALSCWSIPRQSEFPGISHDGRRFQGLPSSSRSNVGNVIILDNAPTSIWRNDVEIAIDLSARLRSRSEARRR
jgi:hypothetical protein